MMAEGVFGNAGRMLAVMAALMAGSVWAEVLRADFLASRGEWVVGEEVRLRDLTPEVGAQAQRTWTVSGPEAVTGEGEVFSFRPRTPGVYDVALRVREGSREGTVERKACLTVLGSQAEATAHFFGAHRALLTATYDKPFPEQAYLSRHAPLTPYLGNGDVGVQAFTEEDCLTLKVSKVDFVSDGRWQRFTNGPAPTALPIGWVRLRVGSPKRPERFAFRMQQLDNALWMRSGTEAPVEVVTWMAPEENLVVAEVSTDSEAPVSVTLETEADGRNSDYAAESFVVGDIVQATRRTKTQGARWVCRAGISTRVLGATVVPPKPGEKATTFAVRRGERVLVVAVVSGGGKGDDARLPEALRRLKALTPGAVAATRAAKEAWWREMWARGYAQTHRPLLDRHLLSSIYLLASATTPHSPACCGMYGVWNMDDLMNYHGDMHFNYNSQGGFYAAFSSNRPELALPYYESLERMIPEGRRRAREEMGKVHPSLKGKRCRGILFPVSALGIGEMYCSYWQQTVNAAWSAPLFVWQYEYTLDENFLRHRAYPYLKACGDFYEDYLTKEPFGESYRYSIMTAAHEGSWNKNPPSDICFVEFIFAHLLRYSELLGIDAERRALWQDILTHLPEYKVIHPKDAAAPVYAKDEDGWNLPNHMLQLHALYPCETLHLKSAPERVEIAKNTLQYYGVTRNGFTGCMNTAGLSGFVQGARVGFSPETLVEKMEDLARTAKPNFLITDGHHCLEKTALVEAIHSMMLQSVEGELMLFPAWLKTPASFTTLRAKGAFLVSADTDGIEPYNVRIHSERGAPCALRAPWPGKRITVTCEGAPVPVTQKGATFTFPTAPGKTYHIAPQP